MSDRCSNCGGERQVLGDWYCPRCDFQEALSSRINEPAFPVFPETGNAHAAAFKGMTLRDWFAGQALAGYSAQDRMRNEPAALIAAWAYEQADAMLAYRSKL